MHTHTHTHTCAQGTCAFLAKQRDLQHWDGESYITLHARVCLYTFLRASISTSRPQPGLPCPLICPHLQEQPQSESQPAAERDVLAVFQSILGVIQRSPACGGHPDLHSPGVERSLSTPVLKCLETISFQSFNPVGWSHFLIRDSDLSGKKQQPRVI